MEENINNKYALKVAMLPDEEILNKHEVPVDTQDQSPLRSKPVYKENEGNPS